MFIATLSAWHVERAAELGIESPEWGAVTVVQRFGSAMQLLPHVHVVAPNGVFGVDSQGQRRMCALPAPTTEEVERLVERVHGRVLTLLRRRGLIPDEHGDAEPDPLAAEDPALAACYDAAVRSPRPLVGEQWSPAPGARAVAKAPLCATFSGFDLHAGVSVSAHDREGLERLCRYLCRPPLSHERLEQLDEDHVALELKTPWSNGTTHVVLSFDELLQRLCALVPRPGTHRVGYHGFLAPAARHRSEVVPSPAEPDEPAAPDEDGQYLMFGEEPERPPRRKTVRRLLWAELLQRAMGIDALRCPQCGGRMRVIATIIEAKVVKAILDCLGLERNPPAVRPSRGPPGVEMVEYSW